ncbi:MAG TPA: sugar phosphate nucleotidyltransferase [Gemmatimonadaceae bacterium]|nr:sugar phosphate nucleotidyltransferase [Gemmatimonadaceae bacterium]
MRDLIVPVVPPPSSVEEPVATLPADEPQAEEQLEADSSMWAIVLAGGIGSRFWPLSTPTRPKQLLNLIGERPLIAETVARLAPLIPPERVLVLTSRDIAPAIRAAIPEIPETNMLVEPRPLGTAAALAWGASEVVRRAGPETLFCCIHADLAVAFPEFFRHTVVRAARVAAREKALVAVGVRATRPETAFGYMRPGKPLHGARASENVERRVKSFIEKPGPVLAEMLVSEGAYWNSGVFVWRGEDVLDALSQYTAELAHGLQALRDRDFVRFAGMIQSVSIERGLLERMNSLVLVPGEFGWDDVGTWASLRRARELDDDGNGAHGQVHFVDCTGNVVHAEGTPVVLFGVSGMLVVTLSGLTFVTTLDRATELRPLLDALPDEIRHVQRQRHEQGPTAQD